MSRDAPGRGSPRAPAYAHVVVLAACVSSIVACSPAPCADRAGSVCAVVGTGELAFNADGLPAEETHLFLASAARRGPDGRVYVMDFNNQRMRVIDDEGLVQTVIGNGFHAIASVDMPAHESPLENPIDFDFLSDDRIVFVSYHDPRVLAVSPDGLLYTIAGAADGVVAIEGNEGDGGPALEALFMQPDGIVVAPGDVIYVSDSLANRVRKIQNGVIDTVAGTGDSASSGDGGPAVDAALFWPSALVVDPAGNLYIAETRGHRVRRVDTAGVITTIVGTGVPGR